MVYEILTMVITGVVAGVLSGMFGLGGGVVIVPILYVFLKHIGVPEEVNMHIAVATSLAVMIVTTCNSIWSHHRKGHIMWPLMAKLAPWMILGSILATILAHFVHADWLRYLFILMLVYIILNSIFKKGFTEKYQISDFREPPKVLGRCVSAAVGFFAVLLGVGGSLFTVPFFRRFKCPMTQASALAVALTPCVSIFGAAGYIIAGMHAGVDFPYDVGYIYLPAFIGISIGTLFGVPVGTKLSSSLDDRYLARTYIVLLFIFLVMIVV